tara:strand:- start:3154 stop:3678 length:525 start_codon:yes stop_codon:yes gene_type:complete
MSVFKIKEMMEFTPSNLKKFGKDIALTHISQSKDGIDADGEQFKAYEPSYAARKGARKAAKNQFSTTTNPPDLTLTNSMFKEFKLIKTSVGDELSIDYGITNPQQAKKMNALRLGRFGKPSKRGKVTIRKDKSRVIAKNQKLGPEVEDAIAFNFAKNIEKNLRRLTNRPTIIRM